MGFIAALLAAGALAMAEGPPGVASGDWGGQHIRLSVTAQGASYDLDCAHGTIDGSLALDAGGKFEAKGTLVRERGGPVRIDEFGKGEPAHYEGTVEDGVMTLRILTGDPPQEFASFRLDHGKPGRVFKCR